MKKFDISSLTLPRKKTLASIISYFITTHTPSKLAQYLVFHVSYLQYVILLLWVQIHVSWNTDHEIIPVSSRGISDTITLISYINDNFENWIYSAMLIATWTYLAVISLLFVSCTIKAVKKSQKNPSKFKRISQEIFMLHFNILFCIANVILVAPWRHTKDFKLTSLGLTSDTLSLINLPLVLLNCFVGGFTSIICFSPFNGIFSSRSSLFQTTTFFAKLLITSMLHFLDNDDQAIQITFSILILVFAWWQLIFLYRAMPYYLHLPMKASVIWTTLAASLCSINIFGLLLIKNLLKQNGAATPYLNLALVPVVVKFALVKLNHHLHDNLGTRSPDLKSESDVLRKLLALDLVKDNLNLALYNKSSNLNIYEIYFLGDLVTHAQTCQKPNCFCSLKLNHDSSENIKDMKISLEHYIEQSSIDLIAGSIQATRENNELRIALANIILEEENQNLSLALINLFGITDIYADFFVRVKKEILLQKAQARLDEYFVDDEKDILDMKTFIDFHIQKAGFTESLLSNTRKYMDFWGCYKQPTFMMTEIIEKSKRIENEADKIEALWNLCTNRYPQFHQQMSDAYCLYLEIVRHCPYRASKIGNIPIFEKIPQKNDLHDDTIITKYNLFLPDILVFSASLSKGKLGKIQYVSENIKTLLGYSQDDLIGKNINVLMSPSLASSHDSLLAKYVQQERLSDGKISYASIKAHIKAKRGFLVSCSVYLTIFPYIQNDINYIAIVRIKDEEHEFMILTEDGLIEGFSYGIGQELNLFNTTSTYFSDLCVNGTSSKTNTKVSKPTNDFFNEIDSSTLENCKTHIRNKYGFFQIKPESGQNDGEIIWKDITFSKEREQASNNENSYIKYDATVRPRIIMGSKFLIITFLRKEKGTFNPKKERNNEILSDVPNEMCSTDKEILSYGASSVLRNSKEQREAKCFKKIDMLSPEVILGTENILSSPKRTQNETHQFNYETEQNLLRKKREDTQLKEILSNKLIVKSEEKRMEEQIDLKIKMQLEKETGIGFKGKKKAKKEYQFSMSSVTKRAISDLEEAVYYIPKEELMNWKALPMFLFSVVCISLLFFLATFTNENLRLIEANLSIMRIANERTFRLIEIKRTTEGVYMLKKGLLANNRYQYYNLPPFQSLVKTALTAGRDSLNKMNGLLRISLNHTELKLHQQFYNNLVPLVRNESGVEIIYKNTFDGVTDLLNRVNIIIGTYPATMSVLEDENLDYIRRNILNELLLSSEKISETLAEDVYMKYDNIIDLSLYVMIATLLSGFVLMIMFLYRQLELKNDRDKFLELFLHIDEHQVTQSLNQVKKYEVCLTQLLSKGRMLEYEEDNNLYSETKEKSKIGSSKGLKIRRKDANMRGLNDKQVLLVILRTILFFIFAAPFIHYFALAKTEQKTLSIRLEKMVEVNTEMYKTMLLTVSLYEYFVTNGTASLRGNPVGEEWENMYRKSSQLQQIFMNLLITNELYEMCDPSVISSLKNIIYGDLCVILPPQRLQEICPVIINGFVRKGMQAVNSFYFSTLRNAKDEFDNSNRTSEAVKKILGFDGLRDIEMILVRWQYVSYDTVGNILKACTLEITKKIQDTVKVILGVYILFFIFGSIVMTPMLWKLMEQERVTWRKIFRMIPIEIVSSSKMLKSYLVKEKGSSFKSN